MQKQNNEPDCGPLSVLYSIQQYVEDYNSGNMGHSDLVVKGVEIIEQYAAQQVQEATNNLQIALHEARKSINKASSVESDLFNQLTEVTRQRDELKEKVLDILPRLVEGCQESYYFHGIKEIDLAYELISQLENEKKDGDQ